MDEFYLEEELYWRDKDSKYANSNENPYRGVTLAEISVNRQGCPTSPISQKEDVLFNIDENKNFERYENAGVITLIIKDLGRDKCRVISFCEEVDCYGCITAEIFLIHDPLKNMYPHSMFRVFYEGEKVTFDNYNQTLNLKDKKDPRYKATKRLRGYCKNHLAEMIYTREVIF